MNHSSVRPIHLSIDHYRPEFDASKITWDAAKLAIPNGTQTLSKCPDRFVNGVYPKFLRRGEGAYVEDYHGRFYIDYICGLGPIILGYHNIAVDNAVVKAIKNGEVLLSLPSKLETALARSIKYYSPRLEKSKFYKTGSDALSAAVKVARAYTGKETILTCGYHGWHDWYTIANDKKAGIPKCLGPLVKKFKYNDLQSLRDLFTTDVAAVVMEPVVYEPPKPGYLEDVIKMAHEHSALVIFDEVVTGFRFGLGGAADYFSVLPDLVCYSKAMGNGYPIAALCGPAEFMDVFERDDFFVSGTFGGDIIGITAAMNVIDLLALPYHDRIGSIWRSGTILKDGFNLIAKTLGLEGVECVGYAPRTMFNFPTVAHKALFWQECVKQGVLFGYANFICYAHNIPTIQNTLSVVEVSLRVVKEAWDDPKKMLEGDMPVEVFRLRP